MNCANKLAIVEVHMIETPSLCIMRLNPKPKYLNVRKRLKRQRRHKVALLLFENAF